MYIQSGGETVLSSSLGSHHILQRGREVDRIIGDEGIGYKSQVQGQGHKIIPGMVSPIIHLQALC
jgi:hypothetical protein